MLDALAIVTLVLAVAIVLSRTSLNISIVKDSEMSAALDRLTASVDAAVAKLGTAPASDDTALNALADKLDAAVNPQPASGTGSDTTSGAASGDGFVAQSLNG